MFEKASRLKLRFETIKGLITSEDLWDLPLIGGNVNLDNIAKDLYRKLQDNNVESFVVKAKAVDNVIELRFKVVTYIIKIKLAEAEKAEQVQLAKVKKRRVLDIIARKEDQALEEISLDDLKKMVEDI